MKTTLKYVLVILLLQLVMYSSAPAADMFNYEMAHSDEFASIESYYQPRPENTTLPNQTTGRLRSVILLIGDGMGPNHVTMARQQTLGADAKLHMERLPVAGLLKTFSANHVITDSAASGTAIACGIKTNNGMIGMTPDKVKYQSILEVLSAKGYRTGLVSTSAITHATPASFAAHTKSRNDQIDIAAHQLENRVDVLFGGGRKFFLPEGTEKGLRKDGRNLLVEAARAGYQPVDKREELLGLNELPAIGLFADEGMTTFTPEPSIAEMTAKAIQLLSARLENCLVGCKPEFFLMVEGSQIDWAAHANDTDRVIRQTLLFDLAVKEAIEFAQKDKHTLVIVTADHETGGLILKDKDGKLNPEWTSGSHTAADVPLYAYGPGSEKFAGIIDNTDISKLIAELTGIKEFPVVKE